MRKTNNTLRILIDADMFVFRACSSCERDIEWGRDIWTLHVDLKEAKAKFEETVEYVIEKALEKMKFSGNFKTIFCFSDTDNFRKHILATYKANRIGKRKPVGYHAMVQWVKDNYETKVVHSLEADDVMGIMATKDSVPSLVISGDKDMKCIPCYHYDFIRDEFYETSKEDALYWFFMQTLMGDSTDGYSGCPKVGKVSAQKLLDKDCSWYTVVSAYKKAGLSEDVALQQAHVAKILLASDYDFKKKEVILWSPKEMNPS